MTRQVYRRRIFLFFFLIISLSSLIYLSLFNKDQNELKRREEQLNIERQISSIKHNINNQLIVIFNQLGKVRGSDTTYLWAGSSGSEYYYYMREVQDMLKRESLNIGGIEYYLGISFKGENKTLITAAESIKKVDYFREFGISPTALTNMEVRIKNRGKGESALIEVSRDKTGSEYIHYIIDSNFYRQDLVFYLTISMDSISSFLKNIDGSWLIMDEDSVFYKIESGSVLSESLLNNLPNNDIQDDTLYRKVIDNKETYWFSFPMVSWRFVYVSDLKGFSIREFSLYFLIPLICLIILSYYLTLFLTNYLYRPIVLLIKQLSNDVSEIDNRDEIEWLINETEALQDSNKRMKDLVELTRERLKEQKIREFVLGYSQENRDLDDNFFKSSAKYRVILLELRCEEGDLIINDTTSLVSEVIMNNLPQDSLFLPIDKNSFIIISMNLSITTLKKSIKKIVSLLDQHSTLELLISMGSEVEGYEAVPSSYKEALNIMEYKYLLGQKLILTPDLIKDEKYSKSLYYPLSVEKRIIDLTAKGEDRAIPILKELMDENLLEREIIGEERKKLIISIKATLNRVFHELKVEPLSVYGKDKNLYEELESFWFDDDIENKIITLFETLLEFIQYENSRVKNELKDQMLEYVSRNFNDDIMLYDVAEELNLSLKYCSALFKKLTGHNFKDYLNHFRVEKAKEILDREREIRINDLAERVGFNSSNTFIRVFKKYVGVSPGSYIKKDN